MSQFAAATVAFPYTKGSQKQSLWAEVYTPDGNVGWVIVDILGLSSTMIVEHLTVTPSGEEYLNYARFLLPQNASEFNYPPLPPDPVEEAEEDLPESPTVPASPRILSVNGVWKGYPTYISVDGQWVPIGQVGGYGDDYGNGYGGPDPRYT